MILEEYFYKESSCAITDEFYSGIAFTLKLHNYVSIKSAAVTSLVGFSQASCFDITTVFISDHCCDITGVSVK